MLNSPRNRGKSIKIDGLDVKTADAAKKDIKMQAETAEKAVNEALSKIQPAKRILKQAQNYKGNLKAANDLFGGNFGYGIGVFINDGAKERVKNAEIKGGVVKVTNSADISVGALLETHYLAKIRDLLILVPGEKAAAYAKTLENESLPEFGVGPSLR